MAALCRTCGAHLDYHVMLCQRCGEWTPNGADGVIGEAVKESDFIDACDVDAQTIERLVTGGPWDEAWGGGFVPSSSTLLGGAPGSGKTTMLLQLSRQIALLTRKPTYYISAEQDKGELKLTIERMSLGLERGQLRLLNKFGMGGSIDEPTLDKTPPGMIILDSVSALCGNDKHAQIAVAKRYKQYAIKYKAPTFLIAHMTKESDFAGLMALQHEVDTLVTLFPEEDGLRHLKAWKNRFGPTHAEYKLLMTAHGLVTPPPKPEKRRKGARSLLGLPSQASSSAPIAASNLTAEFVPRAIPVAIDFEGQKLVRRKGQSKRASSRTAPP
jgi:DNA repair protein RadA/Sms